MSPTQTEAFPTLDDIRAAAARVEPYAHRTPIMTCSAVDERIGAAVYFKCENFQKAGAFKFRGACNTVFSLTDEQAACGVATHSSGNHGAALALAARLRGIPAHVVMPRNAPQIKRDAVAGYGARIIECEPTLAAREATIEKVIAETGAELVHPYNDWRIIAGQATAALELHEEVNGLDIVIAPVGGGGLLSGTALVTHYLRPACNVIAGEPELADDAARSLEAGRIIPLDRTDTIADGLRTSLGERTFAVIQKHVDRIITVGEQQIIDAMHLIWQRMKIIIEPSSAVAVAAAIKDRDRLAGKRIGIILSGGNADIDHLPWIRR